jgi:hypothetical protein
VKKACNLSPLLFNVYIEQAINECKEYRTGIKVNGVRREMLRFADDIAIIAQEEIHLKRAVESLDNILKCNYEMKINRIKIVFSKITVCSKDPENINIKMDDDAVKQVPKFKYLGSIFTEDGKKGRLIQRVKEGNVTFNS